jgi:hypothetical protein
VHKSDAPLQATGKQNTANRIMVGQRTRGGATGGVILWKCIDSKAVLGKHFIHAKKPFILLSFSSKSIF